MKGSRTLQMRNVVRGGARHDLEPEDTPRLRFANSSWTISGCETRSAGRYSTADRLEPRPPELTRCPFLPPAGDDEGSASQASRTHRRPVCHSVSLRAQQLQQAPGRYGPFDVTQNDARPRIISRADRPARNRSRTAPGIVLITFRNRRCLRTPRSAPPIWTIHWLLCIPLQRIPNWVFGIR